MNCLYESVVGYLQSNGWLDTVLDANWESSSFQFYAGDLFDLINNLYLTFSPRALLDGSCSAQKEGMRFFSSREFDANSYTLEVTYNCSLKGTNKEGSTAQATTHTLTFKIIEAELLNLSFEPVGSYFVSNIQLAMFKANSVIKNIKDTFTFGTGFPTIVREMPKTRVDQEQVLYYDTSHIGNAELIDQ
jgi:hypothetical protein